MELMKPEEVAKIFGVELPTIYKMVREGKLQKVDLGINTIRFNPQYIQALCEANASEKTWREMTLEKEVEKLKMQLDKLKGDLGQITSISTNWLR